jgi:alpha-D-ribose 1-methylphosphonate 5-triphosphate synthase subunit PhnH
MNTRPAPIRNAAAHTTRTLADGKATVWIDETEVLDEVLDIVTFHRPTGGCLEFVA